jgi:hypothetical protein
MQSMGRSSPGGGTGQPTRELRQQCRRRNHRSILRDTLTWVLQHVEGDDMSIISWFLSWWHSPSLAYSTSPNSLSHARDTVWQARHCSIDEGGGQEPECRSPAAATSQRPARSSSGEGH